MKSDQARFNGGKNNKNNRTRGEKKAMIILRKSSLNARAAFSNEHIVAHFTSPYPSIWAALSDEAKAEVRKSKDEVKRVAEAAKTDSKRWI